MRRAAWVGLVLYVLTLGATGCGDSSRKSGAGAGAKLVATAGTIELQKADGTRVAVELKKPVDIQPGDTVTAEPGSVAVIADGGHLVQLGHDKKKSVLEYKSPSRKAEDEPSMVVHLVEGMAGFVIPPNEKNLTGDRFKAESNSVIAAVRGTQYEMEIDEANTVVRVAEGVVALIPVGQPAFESVTRAPLGSAGGGPADPGADPASQAASLPNPKEPTSTGETPAEGNGDNPPMAGTTRPDGTPGEILLTAGQEASVSNESKQLQLGAADSKAANELKAKFFTLIALREDPIMNF